MKLNLAQIALRKSARPESVPQLKRFFKTGPGQYAEGDQFIGVTVPQSRKIASEFLDLPLGELTQLMTSPIHEDRTLALHILTENFKKTKNLKNKKSILKFYLRNIKSVNNWDLVDTSAPHIVGAYCFLTNDISIIEKLARSKKHWPKRIAMVSTLTFIRHQRLDLTYQLAKMYLSESEDLMHKACGWMLREAGKKNPQRLLKFIDQNGTKMPRTMLRYAIEKFSPKLKKEILIKTKL